VRPKDPRVQMDINARLDLEAQADSWAILYSDRVGKDCAIVFGGYTPLDRPARSEVCDALGLWTPEVSARQRRKRTMD
jgi:hypothetical protein